MTDEHRQRATFRARWPHGRPFVWGAAWMVLAFSCKESQETKAAEPIAHAVPAVQPGSARGAGGPLSSSYDEDSFSLSLKPRGSYKAGEEGAVEVVLTAKGPYKCNDKYPYKFKTKQTPGIEYPADVIKEDAVQLQAKKATMKIPFKATGSGKKTVAGQFAFSVCTDERCLVERRDLSLDIDVL